MLNDVDKTLCSRLLLLSLYSRDIALSETLLASVRINCLIVDQHSDVQGCLTEGAGAGVVTEEALTGQVLSELIGWIAQQPSWSDFPFILLLDPGVSAESNGQERDPLQQSGNLTLLERPVGTTTLVSAVRAALRARARQFQVHDALE